MLHRRLRHLPTESAMTRNIANPQFPPHSYQRLDIQRLLTSPKKCKSADRDIRTSLATLARRAVLNDHRLCVCLLEAWLRLPTKPANLNTQNVGQKIVSPLSAGPILKPKSALRVPIGQFGKRTRPLAGCYISGRNWLQSLIPNPPHKD